MVPLAVLRALSSDLVHLDFVGGLILICSLLLTGTLIGTVLGVWAGAPLANFYVIFVFWGPPSELTSLVLLRGLLPVPGALAGTSMIGGSNLIFLMCWVIGASAIVFGTVFTIHNFKNVQGGA